jgi:hypothetical protein
MNVLRDLVQFKYNKLMYVMSHDNTGLTLWLPVIYLMFVCSYGQA